MKRFLWLGLALSVYLICSGCGETFRPIIIPNPPTFPNPAASHSVVAINDNEIEINDTPPTFVPGTGSAMAIDVSGDSDMSVVNVGLRPVHAAQQNANTVLVVNQAVTGAAADSMTVLSFSGTSIITSPTPPTISLPPNSAPNFVAIAPSDTWAYVTLPGYSPSSVGVVNTASNAMVATIPVGNNPYALAVTPDKSKLYVANQGDGGTISAFTLVESANTVDLTPRSITLCIIKNKTQVCTPNGAPTSPPIWLSARSDSQRVYVLENSGILAYMDTTSTAGPDVLYENDDTPISVPGATTMTYDPNLNRLYIPGGMQMAIVDVSQLAPQPLATITIPPFTLLNIQQPVPATATAAAALPDGSRAYVSSYAVLPSQFNISIVSGDGTTATYAYTLTAGHDLNPGVTVTVTGTDTSQVSGFDGTYIVSAIVSGTPACPGTCFQAPNSTNTNGTTYPVSGSGTGSNIFPQVSVVNLLLNNSITKTIGLPGFPDATNPNTLPYYAPVCATTNFRFMMAAGGDSSRAYLSSCDGGNVNIIDTSNDTYIENLPAPVGSRAPIPPSSFSPPQNPVFLLAGP